MNKKNILLSLAVSLGIASSYFLSNEYKKETVKSRVVINAYTAGLISSYVNNNFPFKLSKEDSIKIFRSFYSESVKNVYLRNSLSKIINTNSNNSIDIKQKNNLIINEINRINQLLYYGKPEGGHLNFFYRGKGELMYERVPFMDTLKGLHNYLISDKNIYNDQYKLFTDIVSRLDLNNRRDVIRLWKLINVIPKKEDPFKPRIITPKIKKLTPKEKEEFLRKVEEFKKNKDKLYLDNKKIFRKNNRGRIAEDNSKSKKYLPRRKA
jgi:hypothetical protein